MASSAQIQEQQERAAIAQRIVDQGQVDKYVKQWGGVHKLYAFMNAVGQARFTTLTSDYYAGKLHGVYTALPESLRIRGMQILADLADVSRIRIRDMYPHVHTKGGGYELNTNAQAAVLKALTITGPFATHQSGANIPLNPASGLLGDATRANQLYTVQSAANTAQKNYIFDAQGICVAEVDFGNHGGDAVSGHCHPFGLPGCVAFAHHNAGGVHLGRAEYPQTWQAIPGGWAYAVQLGH